MTSAESTLTFVTLGVVGACVGSFLNVAVYRLPAGMSLNHPGSHCPACGHAIRSRDNVPIWGWLWLRGHCRDCGVWISPRYPLVEAGTAAMFLLVGWAVVRAAGAEATFGEVLLRAVYHLIPLSTLLSAALISAEGKSPPTRLFLPALFVGLAIPLFDPGVWPVSRFLFAPDLSESVSAAEVLAARVATALTGGLMGLLAGRELPDRRTGLARELALSGALLGLCWGWAFTFSIVLAAVLVRLTLGHRKSLVAVFFAMSLIVVVLATSGPLRGEPSPKSPVHFWSSDIVAVLFAWFLAGTLGELARRRAR